MRLKRASLSIVAIVLAAGAGWLIATHAGRRLVVSEAPPAPPPAAHGLAAPAPVAKGDGDGAAIGAIAPGVGSKPDPGQRLLAYAEPGTGATDAASAPATPLPSEAGLPPPPPPPPGIELNGLEDAIALYRKGDVAGGDAMARKRSDPLARTMLEWVALRTNARSAGLQRIGAFLETHRDWPSATWLRRRAEELLYADTGRTPGAVAAFFAEMPPISPAGKLALARSLQATGQTAAATTLVRDVWRDGDLTQALETNLLKEFAPLLTAEDDKYRADRLLYKESTAPALRAAARADAQTLLLARARAGAINNAAQASAILDAVPAAVRSDPGYQFARIQSLRRADKLTEAAAMLLAAPRDPALIVDGDAWWEERRLIARKLLDRGDVQTAYRICAEHSAASHEARVEAEFHAGWIALRFLDDPKTALSHFVRAAAAANTPDSIARAFYWEARAKEATGDAAAAAKFYDAAAAHTTTYYGQLARAREPGATLPIHVAADAAVGDERHEATRVVELLYALGEANLALPLVIDAVQHLPNEPQLAALGAVVAAYHDPRATLRVGKMAGARGFALDDLAYPTFGIPPFEPVANSADRPVVYSIARQESAFEPTAVSGSGAKGLMQLLTSTARETAQRAGVDFDEKRLTTDPAFNAKLGAAFLGSLLDAENGSYILAVAAYNAGGRRVQDWINAYGDPRDPAVDPVDWVELIPFTETRHYVQTVLENLQVYRARFGQHTALTDLGLTRPGL
jgi:soluble lytic murein transglycosylase